MLGVHVTVPIACFRKGMAREYLETEPLPPPATCYGFLLALVGEVDRWRHSGVRVVPVLIGKPDRSVVLRTVWRIKEDNYWVDPTGKVHIVGKTKKTRTEFENWVHSKRWKKPQYEYGLGSGSNARPDYQQLLTGVELVIWLDSTEEKPGTPNLEERVSQSLDPSRRGLVARFGGLSLGESTHLVDQVCAFAGDCQRGGQAFLLAPQGRLTLPVWVDHVGSAGTRYVTGDLVECDLAPPAIERMPEIRPPD
jgi:CRISPR-associated protein Cas5t